MYEVRIDPLEFFYKSGNGQLFASITCKVAVYNVQTVPTPPPQNITTSHNASGGLDISVILAVTGEETSGSTEKVCAFYVLLESLSTGLDENEVREAIGRKVYNVSVTTYYDGSPKKTGTGTLSNSSEIEIE